MTSKEKQFLWDIFKKSYDEETEKERQRVDFHEEDNNRDPYQKPGLYNVGIAIFKLVIGLVIVIVLIAIFKDSGSIFIKENKKIEYVEDLKNIKKPKKEKAEGSTTVRVDDSDIELIYKYSYSITGRVMISENRFQYNFTSKLAPTNVVLCWGFLAKNKNIDKVKWASYGNGGFSWAVDDGEWAKKVGGKNKITSSYSVNYLIPANDGIKELLTQMNAKDYVRLEGYLVDVHRDKENGGEYNWKTSTSIEDEDAEILYVTDITWLNSNE